MPVLRSIRERFERERPLAGIRVAACLHVTAETANLVRTLTSGGCAAALCAANPLSTQDDVAAALAADGHVEVRARRGEDLDTYAAHVAALADERPHVTLDDGADLLSVLHARGGEALDGLRGGTEETTTGLLRLRRLEAEGRLACPVLAVNEARAERAFNDRHGTGQSALDGILRATNLLLAGHTLVLLGYGATGKGIAQRARGAGAHVIVCEVDPLRALEARMDAYEVMPALDAAERGDLFVTVTGSRAVLARPHFERMKDGAVLANAGHFDVEIDLDELRSIATGGVRQVLPLVEQYDLGDERRLNLLAQGRGRDGHELRQPGAGGGAPRRERRLARAQGARRAQGAGRGDRPPEARVARRGDRRADARAAGLPEQLGRLRTSDGGRGRPPSREGHLS
jgi:adenosylhomocysteinase